MASNFVTDWWWMDFSYRLGNWSCAVLWWWLICVCFAGDGAGRVHDCWATNMRIVIVGVCPRVAYVRTAGGFTRYSSSLHALRCFMSSAFDGVILLAHGAARMLVASPLPSYAMA